MTLYSLVLFFHVTAVLLMFAALSIELLSLSNLRRASTLAEAQRWMDPVPGAPLIAMGSLLVIFFSGIYLAKQISAFAMAWPKVTIAAILLIAPFGAVSGRRMRAIRRASADAGRMTSELLSRLHDPVLKISLGIRIGVFFAIVLLMAAKPGLSVSVSIVGFSVVLALLWSLSWRHRSARLSDAGVEQGTRQ